MRGRRPESRRRTGAGDSLAAAASVPVREAPDENADLVTEMVPGEGAEVSAERGPWRGVVVPGHGTSLDPRGYPGWIRADAMLPAGGWDPDLTVVARNAANLPLGSLLQSGPDGALLPDGRVAGVEERAVGPVGESCGRTAVEISRSLLGLPYRWGGTDSTAGMDCSGMVYRVMQLTGVRVPRDADDQYEAAPLKTREDWRQARPGDLVFFGEESVTHVGFYLGDGLYVSEHGVGETVVRGVGEDPYWGFARYG